MALHEQCVGATDEWYTPPRVFNALGCSFDMDVASPGREVTPWIPAVQFSTKQQPLQFRGFVWMNAPFGGRNGLVPWLEEFFEHGNGIALVPDRTSAPWWQQFAPRASLSLSSFRRSSSSSALTEAPAIPRRKAQRCSASAGGHWSRCIAPPQTASAFS